MPIFSCLSLTPLMSMPSPMPMPSMSPAHSCVLLAQASVIRQLHRRSLIAFLSPSLPASLPAARVEVACDSNSTAIYLAFLTNAL